MLRTSIVFIVVAALAAGCKKKEETASSEPAPAAPATKPAEPPKPAPAPTPAPEPPAAKEKVFEYASAQAFNDDYRSVKGAAFMDKFGLDGKFRVTGTVGTVIKEQAGNSKVMLALDDKKKIVSLGFADDGKAVAAKGLKKGDPIKVLCKAGGSDDNMIMLVDCALE